jgi:hypothetical protein
MRNIPTFHWSHMRRHGLAAMILTFSALSQLFVLLACAESSIAEKDRSAKQWSVQVDKAPDWRAAAGCRRASNRTGVAARANAQRAGIAIVRDWRRKENGDT